MRAALPDLTSRELVELQLEENDWWVRRARLELAARGPDPEARDALRSILFHNRDVTRRLRALWALHGMGSLDETTLARLMSDEAEELRAWAVQLALEEREARPLVLSTLVRSAPGESSSLVRLHMAAALQRLPLEQRWSLAAQLTRHGEDADDARAWLERHGLVDADGRLTWRLRDAA